MRMGRRVSRKKSSTIPIPIPKIIRMLKQHHPEIITTNQSIIVLMNLMKASLMKGMRSLAQLSQQLLIRIILPLSQRGNSISKKILKTTGTYKLIISLDKSTTNS